MSKKVKFNRGHDMNGITYKKGDVMSVSTSIYENLTKDGIASEFKSRKVAAKKASSKKEETK